MRSRPTPRCARVGCDGSERKHVRELQKCAEGWAYSASAGWHVQTDSEECRCEGFVAQAAPEPAIRKRGRQNVKRGERAERRVERVTGDRRRGGPGRADTAGRNETKTMGRQVRGHILQAIRLGGYDAVVRYVDIDEDLGIWELRRA